MLNRYHPIIQKEVNRLKGCGLSATDFMILMMLGWRAMRPAEGMTFGDVAKCLSDTLGEGVDWHDVCNKMELEK